MPISGESAGAILAEAHRNGYPWLTAGQLAGWHRAGLIRTPDRLELGRAGTQSIYPAGTIAAVLIVCRHLDGAKPRDLRRLAWQLYWQGHSFAIDGARQHAISLTEPFDRVVRILRRAPLARIERFIQLWSPMVRRQRTRNRALRSIRRRLAFDDLSLFVRGGAYVAAGVFDPDSKDSLQIGQVILKGLGLQRATTDSLQGAEPWLPTDVRADLVAASKLIAEFPLAEGLTLASDAEIELAREQAQLFLKVMEGITEAVEYIFGEGAFGFGVIRYFRMLGHSGEVLITAAWLMFRRSGDPIYEEGINSYLQCWPQVESLLRFVELVKTVRCEIPTFSEPLDPRKVARSLRYRGTGQALNAQIRMLADEHREELHQLFDRHPELHPRSVMSAFKSLPGDPG